MVSTQLKPPSLRSGEQRVALRNLSWQQYQQILNALPSSRAARLTYLHGTLEISMPLEDHDHASEMISVLIRILVIELGLKLKSMGSTTLDREELDRGAEPDKSYYIKNQPVVAGRNIDLQNDPPPDLVVEVDITHTDIDKNRLYAAMGVPEFWRYNGRVWRIYHLSDGCYIEVTASPTFPMVKKEEFYAFLDAARQDEIEAEVWLRNLIKKKLN